MRARNPHARCWFISVRWFIALISLPFVGVAASCDSTEATRRDSGPEDTSLAKDTHTGSRDTARFGTDASWGVPTDPPRTLVAKRLGMDRPPAVDGALDDPAWSSAMRVTLSGTSEGSDNRVAVQSLWSEDTLYFGVRVRDSTLSGASEREIWMRDSVELFLDLEHDRARQLRSDDYHVLVDAEGRTSVTRGTADGKKQLDGFDMEAAVSAFARGFRVELAIPVDALNFRPVEHRRLGFLFANNDREDGERVAFAWGQLESFLEPSKWGDLRLGGTSPTTSIPTSDAGPREGETGDVDSSGVDATPEQFRTIRVPANSTKRFDLGDGDTLENLLVDVTASQADFHITADGDNWAIRDLGVRGTFSIGDGESGGPAGVPQIIDVQGKGVIENVYLGDGIQWGLDKTALRVDEEHGAHIEVRNVYIARWSTNAVYAAGFGRIRPPGQTDGAGGTIAFRDSYFHDNNVAHLRLAADGTVVEGCVFHNTNRVPPVPKSASGASGIINSRGIYTGYGDPKQVIEVRNSDFKITDANTCNPSKSFNACAASVAVSDDHDHWGELSTVRFIDSQIQGRLVGAHVETQNVGNNPDLTIPAGVPQSPKAAAQGL